MKILFAGTPEFAVAALLALHQEHQIVAVFTQPDRRAGRGKKLTPPPVKIAALECGIEVHQPQTLKDQAEIIAALKVDVFVVVAYGMLLPQTILDLPRIACINIHASLLPRWRGAAPIQRAIEAGDATTGVSIMRMQVGLDTGPVYKRLEIPIDAEDTSASLHDKLAKLGAEGVLDTVNALSKNPKLDAQEQDDEFANYAQKISKDEANIDWTQSAAIIEQKIRAFNPWPICQTHLQGQRIRIWQARLVRQTSEAAPGEIIAVDEQSITVACGAECLELKILQRAGSKALPVREFCNGFSISAGQSFGDA